MSELVQVYHPTYSEHLLSVLETAVEHDQSSIFQLIRTLQTIYPDLFPAAQALRDAIKEMQLEGKNIKPLLANFVLLISQPGDEDIRALLISTSISTQQSSKNH